MAHYMVITGLNPATGWVELIRSEIQDYKELLENGETQESLECATLESIKKEMTLSGIFWLGNQMFVTSAFTAYQAAVEYDFL